MLMRWPINNTMKKYIISLIILGASQSFADTKLDRKVASKEPNTGVAYALPIIKQNLGFNNTDGRKYQIPIRLSGKRAIKITINHGYDDSGDKGLSWRLVEPLTNKIIAKGFTKSKKDKSWTVKNIVSLNPLLIIEDKDTKMTGKSPGNGFALSVKFAK